MMGALLGSGSPAATPSPIASQINAGIARLHGKVLPASLSFASDNSLAGARLPTKEREHFAGDIAGISFRSEKHKRRRDLFGLRWPFHRRLLTRIWPSPPAVCWTD
jgi:hypothetical protein